MPPQPRRAPASNQPLPVTITQQQPIPVTPTAGPGLGMSSTPTARSAAGGPSGSGDLGGILNVLKAIPGVGEILSTIKAGFSQGIVQTDFKSFPTLRSSAELLGVEIGQRLVPVVKTFSDMLQGAADKLYELRTGRPAPGRESMFSNFNPDHPSVGIPRWMGWVDLLTGGLPTTVARRMDQAEFAKYNPDKARGAFEDREAMEREARFGAGLNAMTAEGFKRLGVEPPSGLLLTVKDVLKNMLEFEQRRDNKDVARIVLIKQTLENVEKYGSVEKAKKAILGEEGIAADEEARRKRLSPMEAQMRNEADRNRMREDINLPVQARYTTGADLAEAIQARLATESMQPLQQEILRRQIENSDDARELIKRVERLIASFEIR
jgi:hypothetical protein